jgi:hypothetical protein
MPVSSIQGLPNTALWYQANPITIGINAEIIIDNQLMSPIQFDVLMKDKYIKLCFTTGQKDQYIDGQKTKTPNKQQKYLVTTITIFF